MSLFPWKMRWHECFIIFLLLKTCAGASTTQSELTEEKSQSETSIKLPFDNIFSFISYFANPSSAYDNQISNRDSCQEETCSKTNSDSSEAIIIYDVEEQVLPSNDTGNTSTSTENHSKQKRDTSESKRLGDSSQARHKEVRPYPGYFLGRKLWYVPLWFGVYYAFYLTCLVVKSVARHRIHYPALLPADTTFERKRARQKQRRLDSMAKRVTDSVRTYSDRYKQYQ